MRATVVTNAPFPREDLEPTPEHDPDGILDHGLAVRRRRLGAMVRPAPNCWPIRSHWTRSRRGDAWLSGRTDRASHGNPRVRFRKVADARDRAERQRRRHREFLRPPLNVIRRYELPNRFFELVPDEVRLPLGIGQSPEMARLVHLYRNGFEAVDCTTESLVPVINSLDECSIAALKRASKSSQRWNSAPKETKSSCMRGVEGALLSPPLGRLHERRRVELDACQCSGYALIRDLSAVGRRRCRRPAEGPRTSRARTPLHTGSSAAARAPEPRDLALRVAGACLPERRLGLALPSTYDRSAETPESKKRRIAPATE